MNNDYLIDHGFVEDLKKRAAARMKGIMAQRTEILEAFIAKHGADPEQMEQVVQTLDNGDQLYYIRRKPIPDDLAKRIIAGVCAADYLGVTPEEVMSKNRHAPVVLVRHMAMYILRQHHNAKYWDIAQMMGGMNHASVIHGVNSIASGIRNREEVDRLYGDSCKALGLAPIQ